MSNNDVKILVVDDDKFVQKLVTRYLKNQYDVIVANDGNEGIALAKKQLPSAIVLDIEMPGINGYAVCEILKNTPSTSHIPIIFLSSHCNLQGRLLAYESGGDDFITKPFDAVELVAKMKILVSYAKEKVQIIEQMEEAQNAAFIAMVGSSELGQAIHFVEQSFIINDYETLAKKLFTVTAGMGLNCCLLFSTSKQEYSYSSSGVLSPIELELMSKFKNEKRFIDFGCRTLINFTCVSLLVKNMPLVDMNKYGRYKDFLPILVGAASAKIKTLDTKQVLIKQTKSLNTSIQSLQSNLSNLAAELKKNHTSGMNSMKIMLEQLEKTIPHMGLEDDQEDFILNNVSNTIDDVAEIFNDAVHIGQSFDHVLASLQKLVDQQNKVINLVQAKDKEVFEVENNGYEMDIELF